VRWEPLVCVWGVSSRGVTGSKVESGYWDLWVEAGRFGSLILL
jgi:hypothetical protein